jgi:hypothetical protein
MLEAGPRCTSARCKAIGTHYVAVLAYPPLCCDEPAVEVALTRSPRCLKHASALRLDDVLPVGESDDDGYATGWDALAECLSFAGHHTPWYPRAQLVVRELRLRS